MLRLNGFTVRSQRSSQKNEQVSRLKFLRQFCTASLDSANLDYLLTNLTHLEKSLTTIQKFTTNKTSTEQNSKVNEKWYQNWNLKHLCGRKWIPKEIYQKILSYTRYPALYYDKNWSLLFWLLFQDISYVKRISLLFGLLLAKIWLLLLKHFWQHW